jgi:hypothetical protein
MSALDAIIKRSLEILETSDDNREKLQAMELFKDIHLIKLELLSNATTIDSALNYIRNKHSKKGYRWIQLLLQLMKTTATAAAVAAMMVK